MTVMFSSTGNAYRIVSGGIVTPESQDFRSGIADKIVSGMKQSLIPADRLSLPLAHPPVVITGDLAREHLVITDVLASAIKDRTRYAEALTSLDRKIAEQPKILNITA